MVETSYLTLLIRYQLTFSKYWLVLNLHVSMNKLVYINDFYNVKIKLTNKKYISLIRWHNTAVIIQIWLHKDVFNTFTVQLELWRVSTMEEPLLIIWQTKNNPSVSGVTFYSGLIGFTKPFQSKMQICNEKGTNFVSIEFH